MERRGTIELRSAGNRLEGYAAVFNSLSDDLGGFVEIIRPGAFQRALQLRPDVFALYEHDTRQVLGRTQAGTLNLAEDDKGLRFSIDMPSTSTGKDLLVSVGRGDISGASFAFIAKEDRWTPGNSGMLRELIDVELLDVTITATPAYPETTVARRALGRAATPARLDMCLRYIETMGAN